MVFLRSSGNAGAEPGTTPKRGVSEMDTSSEFLSLLPASQRKTARVTRSSRGLDDSFSSPENSSASRGHGKNEEKNRRSSSLRTRAQRVKLEASFSNMDAKANSSANDDKAAMDCTRKSPRLQKDGKQSMDLDDEVEESSTPKRSQFNLRLRETEDEDEDHTVRRSSRITRYRLDSRKQSVLYDRLITNTAEAVLQKMDDMQKMRRRLRSKDTQEQDLGIYTRGRLRSLSSNVERQDPQREENQGAEEEEENDQDEDGEEVDEEDEEDDDDDDDEEEEEDEDGEEGENQKRYDFRQRKTVVRYQAPQEEPREPRKRSIYDHRSPTRRRFRFSSTAPRSPYSRRRSSRRRHAIHSSDSTSSSSSSDEEKFQRRRSKNTSKSVNRCLPMNLVKEDLLGIHKDRMKIGASLADVDPMQIDRTVRFDGIGGLEKHISALKEMVVFPLLYPEVFEKFKIQPPRGCLFYGPPGTGKTLVARALANECSQGERKVSFFMRKGADCLSKWVGESERQLRLLFDQAYQMRPSIIFFDEIDGLAPVRSSRQDQIHSSIVSTLLALMDGLDSRGEVVVIGATNRLDSIDPALRRPGRFDREFLFGLPDREARKDILKIHTRQWRPPPLDIFLEELADKCVGYCGADIKAVCSEAALCALRRRYPQIYSSSQKLVLDVNSISITSKDFMTAMSKMVPAAQRAVASPAKALIPAIRPLLSTALQTIIQTVSKLFPHAELGLKRRKDRDISLGLSEDELMFSDDESAVCSSQSTSKEMFNLNRSVLSQPTSYRPRLLLQGRPGSGQSSYLAPAVLHTLEKFSVYTLDMAVLFGGSAAAPEETCAQIFVEAKRTSPSILYIPHIGQCLQYDQLNTEVQELFRVEYGEVFHIQVPTSRERRHFFEDLILNQAAKAPASRKKAVLHALEVLPVAPPPAPRQLTPEEVKKLQEQEEGTLRELRLFLRDVTNRLSLDKRFKAFTKPVDLEEVPDYVEVIKKPMDLSSVLTKIDLHQYGTIKEFLHDVDLIWQNALEYNPDRDPSDRQIRHRACALKDTVHAIIKDELDEDFEKICEEIKESRRARGCATSAFTPSFYHVLPKQPKIMTAEAKVNDVTPQRGDGTKSAVTPVMSTPATTPKSSGHKRRRRRSRWASGIIVKKKLSTSPHVAKDDTQSDDEEEYGEDEEQGDKVQEKGTNDQTENVEVSADCTDKQQQLREQGEGSQAGAEPKDDCLEMVEVAQNKDGSSDKTEMVSKVQNDSDEMKETHVQERSEALQCLAEMEIQKTQSSQQQNVNEPNSHSEAMDVDEDSKEDDGEQTVRHMTRAIKTTVQRQEMMPVDQALQILEEETPLLEVDRSKLKELLEMLVVKSEGYELHQLEKLYAVLCQAIYRHRREYNKTALIQELENEIKDFC
uniref:ATPase family AAA domain-containing protein 2 n=1 Tax=Knipowitschia caucasica TaxID=637954 RepID=A0AAV2MBB2_KNICA